ncbi:MAG: hypothetical protein PHS14_19470 [Elusimicrobia bacterium]|nr:hypothetical protein [Elusimicrobiota bacterium]
MLDVVGNDRASTPLSPSDYRERYLAARREAARMGTRARAKLADVYLAAADQAAAVVADALERGLSKLTADHWAAVEKRLRAAADAVAQGTETVARAVVADTASLFPEIDADYIYRAARSVGAAGITRSGLERMVSSLSSRVVESLTTRLWSDGYSFSERIWGGAGVRGDWLERMKMVVAAGIAQGRDPVKIAKDIQIYTADGLIALTQRWGGLERGTSAFARRIPGRVDWRAQRLVRTELYASLREASVVSGEANPGGDGLYDWVLSIGRKDWGCECPELAKAGPYKADEIPVGHPSCLCWVRPHLRPQAEFLSDLRKWARGESVGYLDDWYSGPYRSAK